MRDEGRARGEDIGRKDENVLRGIEKGYKRRGREGERRGREREQEKEGRNEEREREKEESKEWERRKEMLGGRRKEEDII